MCTCPPCPAVCVSSSPGPRTPHRPDAVNAGPWRPPCPFVALWTFWESYLPLCPRHRPHPAVDAFLTGPGVPAAGSMCPRGPVSPHFRVCPPRDGGLACPGGWGGTGAARRVGVRSGGVSVGTRHERKGPPGLVAKKSESPWVILSSTTIFISVAWALSELTGIGFQYNAPQAVGINISLAPFYALWTWHLRG